MLWNVSDDWFFFYTRKEKELLFIFNKEKKDRPLRKSKLTVFPSRPVIKCVIFRMPILVFRAWATCKLVGSFCFKQFPWIRHEIRHRLQRNDCSELTWTVSYGYKVFWWINFYNRALPGLQNTVLIWSGTRQRGLIHADRSRSCVKRKHLDPGSWVRCT